MDRARGYFTRVSGTRPHDRFDRFGGFDDSLEHIWKSPRVCPSPPRPRAPSRRLLESGSAARARAPRHPPFKQTMYKMFMYLLGAALLSVLFASQANAAEALVLVHGLLGFVAPPLHMHGACINARARAAGAPTRSSAVRLPESASMLTPLRARARACVPVPYWGQVRNGQET